MWEFKSPHALLIMNLKKLEHTIDKSIPYFLILLTLLIIVEIFFHDIALKYRLLIEISDSIIIFVFILDLIFKYRKMRDIKNFIKSYWIEIIAIIPFYLIFRTLELLGLFGLREAQQITHIGVEIERETKVIKAAEEVKFVTRAERFGRFIRPVLRLPRFLKAVEFFEKPKKH